MIQRYRSRLVRAVALCAFLALFSIVSCTREQSSTQRGGTLIVGEISDFESLNPMGTSDAHARDVYNLLFLSLLDEQGDFLTFEPRLAESYEFSADRARLVFHLRRDVFWSDGVPCTAHDVAATFLIQKNPDVLWSGRHLKEHIDSVTVEDDFTVAYHFNKVYMYQVMDANDGPILPKHAFEGVPPAEIGMIPAEDLPVNGPFRIAEWQKGQALTLVPNERYYEEGKPYLERVVFKIIPDQVTLLTQLRSGEIDCMESIPYAEVGKLGESNPELRIFDYETRAYIFIGWNGAHPLFRSRNVRRALTMAIDRSLIMNNLTYGFAEECTGPFVPLIWAYNPHIEPLPHDPERARELLAEEGFTDSDGDGWLDRNGETFEFELLTNYGNQVRSDIQVMVQEMLRKVGIKVNTSALEWLVYLDRLKSSDFDAVVHAWRVGTKADLSPIWSCEARKEGGYNRVNYCNPVVDSLNALAAGILDFEEAKPLFYRAQEIVYGDQPYTFIYTPHALAAVNRRFKNVHPDPIGMYHFLYEWWVEETE
jgi:peptide/nickel transport system substrate-binding protein